MDASERTMKQIVLQRMGRCRVCHRTPSPDDIETVSKESDVWTMVVQCPDCHARSFVAAVLNEADADKAAVALRRMSEGEISLELGEGEVEYVEVDDEPAGEPVDVDDVLELHDYLDTFDGNFRRLFSA